MKPKIYEIGTIGVAARDVGAYVGKIRKGSRVKIVDIDDFRGYALLDLDTGLKITETGFNSFAPFLKEEKHVETELGTGDVVVKNERPTTGRIGGYPTSRRNDILPIGTVGFATEDHRAYVGTIKKGARVQIVGIDEFRGYALLDLDTGLKITETGFNSIVPTLKEDLKQNDPQLANGSTGGSPTPKKPKKFSIGRVGFASRDIRAISGTISKGSRVQIVGIDEFEPSRGYELLDLETGLKLIETGFDSFVPAKIGEIQFPVGTIGIASGDHRAYVGTIKKGSVVQIVGIDSYRGYELLDIDTGLKLSETGFGSIIPVEFENLFDMNNNGKTL